MPKRVARQSNPKYEKKEIREHILIRPETYVGSVTPMTKSMRLWDESTRRIESRPATYVPAALKIFDEVAVNAADNSERDPAMNHLDFYMNTTAGSLEVINNGEPIPVTWNEEHNCYNATLIFSHFLTGSNFDDENQKRLEGGRNGYGAKLANTCSNLFRVRIVDAIRGKFFEQVFEDNMSKVGQPRVTDLPGFKDGPRGFVAAAQADPNSRLDQELRDKGKLSDMELLTALHQLSSVSIYFEPDMKFLNMEEEGFHFGDTEALIHHRVLEIAGTLTHPVTVSWNGEVVPVSSFRDYAMLFSDMEEDMVLSDWRSDNGRWQVLLTLSQSDQFEELSFVNGVCTQNGGTHVTHAIGPVVEEVLDQVAASDKGALRGNFTGKAKSKMKAAQAKEKAKQAKAKAKAKTKSKNGGGGRRKSVVKDEVASDSEESKDGGQSVTSGTASGDTDGKGGTRSLKGSRLMPVTLGDGDTLITANSVRSLLRIFLCARIENPKFDAQTKETLTSQVHEFGSTCDFPSSFVSDFVKAAGLVDTVKQLARNKMKDALIRSTAKKRQVYVDIPKLVDAYNAGKQKADCTLILTEGDSAKTLAIAGLSDLPASTSDNMGVFPLRGKLNNIRGMKMQALLKTMVIQDLIKIVGLNPAKRYTSFRDPDLRYQHIMIMADQDADGGHIACLLVNLFQYQWPELLATRGFLRMFVTPLVKAIPKAGSREHRAQNTLSFLSEAETDEWKVRVGPAKAASYKYRYYKGLGTHNAGEAKLYFRNMDKHIIDVDYTHEDRLKWEDVPPVFSTGTAEAQYIKSQVKKEARLLKAEQTGSMEQGGQDDGEGKGEEGTGGDVSMDLGMDGGSLQPIVDETELVGAMMTPVTAVTPDDAAGESTEEEIEATALLTKWASKSFSLNQDHVQALENIKRSGDGALLKVAFDKTGMDARRIIYLLTNKEDMVMDYRTSSISIHDLVLKILMTYAHVSNERAIPNYIDGLKGVQRKILYTMMKLKRGEQQKIITLAGMVSEKARYHHGDKSLCDAIVKMAQSYVGTNNLNLLLPQGQVGTRRRLGEDAAAPRYTQAGICDITNLIFRREDACLLDHLEDEGVVIEPEVFFPIIPIALINGSKGIGYAFSNETPRFNPKDVIEHIRWRLQLPKWRVLGARNVRGRLFVPKNATQDDSEALLDSVWRQFLSVQESRAQVEEVAREAGLQQVEAGSTGQCQEGLGVTVEVSPTQAKADIDRRRTRMAELFPGPLVPWYRGFKGTVTPHPSQPGTYITRGIVRKDPDSKAHKYIIQELPVNTAIEDYKVWLDGCLMEKHPNDWLSGNIRRVYNKGSHIDVYFEVETKRPVPERSLETIFKLTHNVNTNCMTYFTDPNRLHRFKDAEDLLEMYMWRRIWKYDERRLLQLQAAERECVELEAMSHYIQMQLDGKLEILNKKKDLVSQCLLDLGFLPKSHLHAQQDAAIDEVTRAKIQRASGQSGSGEEEGEQDESEEEDDEEGQMNEEGKTEVGGGVKPIEAMTKAELWAEFRYLTKVEDWRKTEEEVSHLKQVIKEKRQEVARLRMITPAEMWESELREVAEALPKHRAVMKELEGEGLRRVDGDAQGPGAGGGAKGKATTKSASARAWSRGRRGGGKRGSSKTSGKTSTSVTTGRKRAAEDPQGSAKRNAQ